MYTIVERVTPLMVMSLDEAKQQLSIVDFNDDDDYIESLILVAGDMAERHKKTLYSECLVKAQMSKTDYCGFLPLGPVIEVQSAVNDGNNLDFSFNQFSGRIEVDTNQMNMTKDTIITYRSGHVEVPHIVKQACKIIVSDLYENRESGSDVKITNVIFNALRLLK